MKPFPRSILPHRPAILIVAFALAVVWPRSGAWSQLEGTVKVVVPYPPGGGASVLARVLADAIGKLQGPTMVVQNRPGAGTEIGTNDVVHAVADGTTLLMTNNALVILPHLRKLDYDPLTSLTPICKLATTPTIIVVNSQSPYRTLADLLGAARTKPGVLTFGAAPGALSAVSFEMLMRAAGVRMTMVPFTGTFPINNAILGAQVDAAFVDYPSAEGLVQSGKLRALATGSAARVDWLPEVPTVRESGFKNFEIELWFGLLAPASTAPKTVSQLVEWFSKAAIAPGTQSRLATQGVASSAECGAPFAVFLKNEYDKYGSLIRDANIKGQ
jgi:tripartite-type tricarboxylate transporter receptor subunit TctC